MGRRTVDSFHRQLGKIVWDYCGMSGMRRVSRPPSGRSEALREEYWENVTCSWFAARTSTRALEKAGRVADFFELAELMCVDALERKSRAAATFARSIKRRTARPSAMMNTIRMSPLGNIGERETRKLWSRNHSSSTMSTRLRGATSR